jgi:hypothetical protein
MEFTLKVINVILKGGIYFSQMGWPAHCFDLFHQGKCEEFFL